MHLLYGVECKLLFISLRFVPVKYNTGPIEKLLNNRFVVPMGRLCYAVYLVNITIMMIIESKQRVAVSPSIEVLVSKILYLQ